MKFLFLVLGVCTSFLLEARPPGLLAYDFPNPRYTPSYPRYMNEEVRKIDYSALEVPTKKPEELILENIPSLEKNLNQKIIGQEKAIQVTVDAITRFAAGIHDENGVMAALLYCGPSGVGKTELAKQLCLELYGDLKYLIRIDMSEYQEGHSLSRLIGAPPGYVGFGKGGVLTEAISKNPYAVVLLDEIEKADPDVLKIFLHVLDEGRLSSTTGQKVDCRHCIFIMTSNLASRQIAELCTNEESSEIILEKLKPVLMKKLSPELFNRLEPIVFQSLSKENTAKIVRHMLERLEDRVFATKAIQLCFDDSLVEYLVAQGIDPTLGVRPLKRLIDKELGTLLAKAIIEGKFTEGDCLKFHYQAGKVLIKNDSKK